MRQIFAIVFLSLAVVFCANAEVDDIQRGIFDSYLKLANTGDMVAQYVVAQRYETGKGTTKDLEKAYYWYEKAAKQNYPLAIVKLEERQKQLANTGSVPAEKLQVATTAPASAPTDAQLEKPAAKKPPIPHKESAAKPKKKVVKKPSDPAPAPSVPMSKPVPTVTVAPKQENKPEAIPIPPPVVVAKATVSEEPPLPAINVMQALLAGKWKRNQQDAEFLPSSHVACLQSGGAEVVCFSEELTRNIDQAGLTYNVKSVISSINNKEARFNLRYIYNVVHIADRPFAQPNGIPNEANDMAVKIGWQEPGVALECRLRDDHMLTCTRTDRKMSYQFVRE